MNTKIKRLAEERKILFLDLNRRLAPNKQLLPAFTNDGLHLNKAGYQAWKDELAKSQFSESWPEPAANRIYHQGE